MRSLFSITDLSVEEIQGLIAAAYARCEGILTERREQLDAVARYLLENETMTGEQFAACMEGREIGEAKPVSLFDGHTEEKPNEDNTSEG